MLPVVFVAQFVSGAGILGISEGQAYISLPYVSRDIAKNEFLPTQRSTRAWKRGSMCLPEAVEYLLRSHATNIAI